MSALVLALTLAACGPKQDAPPNPGNSVLEITVSTKSQDIEAKDHVFSIAFRFVSDIARSGNSFDINMTDFIAEEGLIYIRTKFVCDHHRSEIVRLFQDELLPLDQVTEVSGRCIFFDLEAPRVIDFSVGSKSNWHNDR